MSATLHIFKAALDDLQDALDWYASQSAGLEQRFSRGYRCLSFFISDNCLIIVQSKCFFG